MRYKNRSCSVLTHVHINTMALKLFLFYEWAKIWTSVHFLRNALSEKVKEEVKVFFSDIPSGNVMQNRASHYHLWHDSTFGAFIETIDVMIKWELKNRLIRKGNLWGENCWEVSLPKTQVLFKGFMASGFSLSNRYK